MAIEETLIVTTDFTTLDLLLWRRFNSEARGRVEATAAMNYHLADLPLYLPIGTPVVVEIPDATAVKAIPVTRLWE